MVAGHSPREFHYQHQRNESTTMSFPVVGLIVENPPQLINAVLIGQVSVGVADALQTLSVIGIENTFDPTDQQFLAYNATDNLWEPTSLPVNPGVADAI